MAVAVCTGRMEPIITSIARSCEVEGQTARADTPVVDYVVDFCCWWIHVDADTVNDVGNRVAEIFFNNGLQGFQILCCEVCVFDGFLNGLGNLNNLSEVDENFLADIGKLLWNCYNTLAGCCCCREGCRSVERRVDWDRFVIDCRVLKWSVPCLRDVEVRVAVFVNVTECDLVCGTPAK